MSNLFCGKVAVGGNYNSTRDNEFGDLRSEYTIDGLHLSLAGYDLLKKIIIRAIHEYRPK